MRASASAPLFDKSPIPGEPPWKDPVIRRRTPPFVSSIWPLTHAAMASVVLWGLTGPTPAGKHLPWSTLAASMLAATAGASLFFSRHRPEGVQPAHHCAARAPRIVRP